MTPIFGPSAPWEANQRLGHPIQSWEWGEFKRSLGYEVVRSDELGLQFIIRREPRTGLGFAFVPRGPRPTPKLLTGLQRVAREHGCLSLQLEPDVSWAFPLNDSDREDEVALEKLLREAGGLTTTSRFSSATFLIDLTSPEPVLRQNLHSKTRYNIGVARRSGVTIERDISAYGFEAFFTLFETHLFPRLPEAQRPSPTFLRKFWSEVGKHGWVHVLSARLGEKLVASLVLLKFGDRSYCPYSVSDRSCAAAMAPSLLMWEAMIFAKGSGCKSFDLWTARDCDRAVSEDSKSVSGVHRFLAGFGGQWRKMMPAWRIPL